MWKPKPEELDSLQARASDLNAAVKKQNDALVDKFVATREEVDQKIKSDMLFAQIWAGYKRPKADEQFVAICPTYTPSKAEDAPLEQYSLLKNSLNIQARGLDKAKSQADAKVESTKNLVAAILGDILGKNTLSCPLVATFTTIRRAIAGALSACQSLPTVTALIAAAAGWAGNAQDP